MMRPRARPHGKLIVLCAISQSVSRDMLTTALLFPVEAELGIQMAERGDVRLDLAAAPPESDRVYGDAVESDEVLGRFVWKMHNLKSHMNFVDYHMRCNRWMLDWELAWNEYQCRRLLDEYAEDGTVELHDAFNPNNPYWPTPALG